MIPKAIIDTNVWISGLFWGGVPFRILEKVYSNSIYSCFSSETFKEWSDKVKAIAQTIGRIDLYIRDRKLIGKNSLFFVPKEPIVICRDPNDNKFLEAAIAAEADFLISGDRDLFLLKKIKETRIITPTRFLKLFP